MKINEIKKRIDNLLEVETKTAIKKRSESIKKNDEEFIIVSQCYLLGLIRISEVLDGLFKELKNVR